MTDFTPYTIARFWSKVDVGQPERCWEWKGGKNAQGYGSFWIDGKVFKAHRIAWELWHGRPMANDLQACHDCHNRACVNPLHMHEGTSAMNHQERVQEFWRRQNARMEERRRAAEASDSRP